MLTGVLTGAVYSKHAKGKEGVREAAAGAYIIVIMYCFSNMSACEATRGMV
jgi:hypothetical protein